MAYVAYKNAFFREMQFWSHCYTVVSYQALFRLSVYKISAVYLLGAKNMCFFMIRDFGSPRDDFNFEIVNYPFLDRDVPHFPSYGVYISQLIRFARVCSNAGDFNNRNLFLTAKLLKQGYRYNKIRKAFSKFYHRHSI